MKKIKELDGVINFANIEEIAKKMDEVSGAYPETQEGIVMGVVQTIIELTKANGIRRNPTQPYDEVRGSFDNMLASLLAGLFMVGKTFDDPFEVHFDVMQEGLDETDMGEGLNFTILGDSYMRPESWALRMLKCLVRLGDIDSDEYLPEIWFMDYLVDILTYASVTGCDVFSHLDLLIENMPNDSRFEPEALPF